MTYFLSNNTGEVLQLNQISELQKFIQQPYQYWKKGAGDSAVYLTEEERIIFFKLEQGVFLLLHPDYIAPIIKADKTDTFEHYVGGEAFNVKEKYLCDEDEAFDILSYYINNGILPEVYQWEEVF